MKKEGQERKKKKRRQTEGEKRRNSRKTADNTLGEWEDWLLHPHLRFPPKSW